MHTNKRLAVLLGAFSLLSFQNCSKVNPGILATDQKMAMNGEVSNDGQSISAINSNNGDSLVIDLGSGSVPSTGSSDQGQGTTVGGSIDNQNGSQNDNQSGAQSDYQANQGQASSGATIPQGNEPGMAADVAIVDGGNNSNPVNGNSTNQTAEDYYVQMCSTVQVNFQISHNSEFTYFYDDKDKDKKSKEHSDNGHHYGFDNEHNKNSIESLHLGKIDSKAGSQENSNNKRSATCTKGGSSKEHSVKDDNDDHILVGGVFSDVTNVSGNIVLCNTVVTNISNFTGNLTLVNSIVINLGSSQGTANLIGSSSIQKLNDKVSNFKNKIKNYQAKN